MPVRLAAIAGTRSCRRRPRRWLALALAAACAVSGAAGAAEYVVHWPTQLEDWRFPAGMVELDPAAGTIQLKRYRGRHNAVSDAARFSHALVDKSVRTGGVHPEKVGSNAATGFRAADGRRATYWRPDPADDVEDWWIEVDLGRATAVTDIRLVFPDEPGARPFREFTLFGSEGRRTGSRQDVHFFRILGGTTRPNADTVVVYDVQPAVNGLVRALPDPTAARRSETESTLDVLQYIRFVADRKSEDAALAEIEVYTPGENIALGTLDRLGSIVDIRQPGARPEPATMADGTMNAMWGTAFAGAVWEWDLGGLFWVRQVILRASAWEHRVRWYSTLLVQITPHSLRLSDGAETLTGEIDYDVLFPTDRDTFGATQSVMPLQVDYRFAPRRTRYLQADWEGSGQTGWIGEAIILPEGHAAEVQMVSDLIDLRREAGGTTSKVIQGLSWETEPLPEGAYIRARTRSGGTVVDSTVYFHQDGREVDRALYEQLEKVNLHGPTQTYQVPGPDWSGWSNWYTLPGQAFQSPSPRRYVQMMLVIGSGNPETTPVVRSLSLQHTEAVLTDIRGLLLPREVPPDVDTLFSLSLAPDSRSARERFNHILILTPSRARADEVRLHIGGQEQGPAAFTAQARPPDSLIVRHEVVHGEPVQVVFRSRVLGNATRVPAMVGFSESPSELPALWQPVNEKGPYSMTVLVPAVAEGTGYISALAVTPIISPNDDGIGDRATVRLSVLRAELLPPAPAASLVRVRIHDLAGRLVADLSPEPGAGADLLYLWAGRDQAGRRVPPGTYLCRVEVRGDAGGEVATRAIGVAY